MHLSNYRDTYYELSGKASDTARSLAFAGIALAWVFRNGGDTNPTFPAALLPPLALLASALAFDLLQYAVAAALFGGYSRWQETRLANIHEDPELDAPPWFNWPGLFFFWGKLALIALAYWQIVAFLAERWLRST